MKRRINISLKQRIYLSFSLLVFLFIINGIITVLTINSNKKLTGHLSKVIEPSLQAMNRFRNILIESKIYTTNWVFLRTDEEDKKLLKALHDSGYIKAKTKLSFYIAEWKDKTLVDSLNKLYAGFEQLLTIQKDIMRSLNKFEDYNDPVIKLEGERKVEEEVLPRTAALINSLNEIHAFGQISKAEENSKLEKNSIKLRWFIILLAITIIVVGTLLSMYMTRVIIGPVNKIKLILNDLGKGITRTIGQHTKKDEIGEMIRSVNNLSGKLEATAAFAHEVGRRNFDIPFQPLSDEDSLGKSLIAMRDNIRSSDEKLNEAQHIARLGSWERNIETDKMTLTDEMFNIFDIDPASFDFRFQSILKLIHPDDIKTVSEGIRKNHHMAPAPIECKIVTSKGVVKDILVETKLRRGKDGDIETTFGIVQDITERKKNEGELRKSEEQYRQIVETSQEGIWLIDENKKTTFANKRICEMLGYSPTEMLGKDLFYFMDEEGMKIAIDSLEKQKKEGSDHLDFKFLTKTGTNVWAYLATSPLLDATGNYIGALAMVTDITLRKQQDELLRNSEAFLEVKNKELERKNKELEQFAYVASHDLQEPLRTTLSFVELLQQQYKGRLDEKADKYLSYITQSSSRMEVLIKDLLDYSRIGHKKELQKVDCNKILQDVLADLDTAIQETQADIQADPLPAINGYPTEVKQLFQNLIANAIKFRKKNTVPEIRISVQDQKGFWEFAFKDNGIGIDQQHSERIFIIFQRLHTRTEYKGSGIGLSHCKKIVELHNGKIWVESTPGKGSTFHFTISKLYSRSAENISTSILTQS